MYDSFENLEKIKLTGRGAFGSVYKFYDHQNYKKLAIKVINNEERFIKPALREIRILKILKLANIDNYPIINILGDFRINSVQYIVFDYMSIDLYKFYKKYPEELDINVSVYFFYNIARGLKYIHSLKIIHCDLKPENIMLRYNQNFKDGRRYEIKIIDFGSTIDEKKDIYFNYYIQSRYYRAPEVLYNIKIGCFIDIWSLGCIIYEIIFKIPLFSGRNEKDMIFLISEVLGIPSFLDIYLKTKRFEYNYNYNIISCSYSYNNNNDLNKKYKLPNKDGFNELLKYNFKKYFSLNFKNKCIITLLKKIIVYNYNGRITAEDILNDRLFLELKLLRKVK